MHHYQHHIGDYSSHTAHLSPLEDIAYRRMLDLYYLHERPFNGRSTDVARLIRMGTHQAEVEVVLKEFFRDVEGVGWVNDRAEEEIEAYKSRRDSAVKAGKVSGKVRRQSARTQANDRSTTVQRPFNGTGTNVEPTGNQYPLTINQVPDSGSAPLASLQKPAEVAEEIWKDFKKHRKGRVTATGIANLREKADAAGMTLEAAMTHMMAMGHQGFFPPQKGKNGLPIKPAEPQRNFLPPEIRPAIVMHEDGDANCQCETCCRNRRNVSLGILNDLSTRRKA